MVYISVLLVTCASVIGYTSGGSPWMEDLIEGNITGVIDDSRIIGGDYVNIKSYPFMAFLLRTSIYYNDTDDYIVNDICCSTILTKKYILTAAHCIENCTTCGNRRCPNCKKYDINSYKVIAGSSTQSVDAEDYMTPVPFISRVRNAYVHPRYRKRCNTGVDIAVVELKKKMIFSDKIQPVPLPRPAKRNTVYHWKKSCTILGWGQTKTESYSERLKAATVSVLPPKKCKKQLTSFCKDINICSDSISKDGEMENPCMGDSGGPLMCGGVQVGVTSYGKEGIEDCTPPAVYTRVDVHINWIRKVIKHH